jgi:trimethylamine--corrinoid protein Co-methyltransferase
MNSITPALCAASGREGFLVEPQPRLDASQVAIIDAASRQLLEEPGVICHNREAAALFAHAGACVEEESTCARVRITPAMIDNALASAPSTVTLGARDPRNRLVLDAHEPRVRFGTGSETNHWLNVSFDHRGVPTFAKEPGSVQRLMQAAHLCEHLDHVDFFIRCVNIRDAFIHAGNKDVNTFYASLSHTTRHVQAGLVDLAALSDVVRMGEIIAGGSDAFATNPVLSFIACVIKSPLQIVDDTAAKVIAIARRGVPVVVSSSPMGGSTGPFDEFGMVAQINAELLAAVTLHQLAAPGAPVIYGSVPVRTRLDNLNDMYGVAEFNHYHHDCAQMARHYGLPCYSTAGIADAETPGIQATFEKMLTLSDVPRSGAQYIHCAFGLLGRSNIFCPEQAVLDDAHVGVVKRNLAAPNISQANLDQTLATVREVMASDHRTYMFHLPLPTRDPVYARYPFEDEHGGALLAAHRRYEQILAIDPARLDDDVDRDIFTRIDGIAKHSPVAGRNIKV